MLEVSYLIVSPVDFPSVLENSSQDLPQFSPAEEHCDPIRNWAGTSWHPRALWHSWHRLFLALNSLAWCLVELFPKILCFQTCTTAGWGVGRKVVVFLGGYCCINSFQKNRRNSFLDTLILKIPKILVWLFYVGSKVFMVGFVLCVEGSSFFQTPQGAAAIQAIKKQIGKDHYAHISDQIFFYLVLF